MRYRAPIVDYTPIATYNAHIADNAKHVEVDEFSPKATVDAHIADNAKHVEVDEFSPKATVDAHIADNAKHVEVDEFVRNVNLQQSIFSNRVDYVGTYYYGGVLINAAGEYTKHVLVMPAAIYNILTIYLIIIGITPITDMKFDIQVQAGHSHELCNTHDTGLITRTVTLNADRRVIFHDLSDIVNFLAYSDVVNFYIHHKNVAPTTNASFVGIRVVANFVP